MSTTVRVATAAACLSSALLLTACGGSSSSGASASGAAASGGASSGGQAASQLQGLSAEQVLEKAKAATASAKSLHYTATGTSDGQKLSFDVRTDKARGVMAELELAGQKIKIVQDMKDVYVFGGEGILGGKGTGGKWAKSSTSNPAMSSLLEIADPAKLTEQFFTLDPGQKVSLGTPKTVDGKQTVALVVSGPKNDGGTMYVSAEGTPYPLLVESDPKGKDTGTLTFSEFDQPVDIKVPDAKDVIVLPA